jgi:hypothetical protein
MSRRLFIYGVIYGLRTDELDGTSTVSINTAESTQQDECSTIIGDLQERHQTIFQAKLFLGIAPGLRLQNSVWQVKRIAWAREQRL